MVSTSIFGRRLSACHGFLVLADGDVVGTVETPVFHGVSSEPDFLVVRVIGTMPGTFRILPSVVVDEVDVEQWAITVGMTWDAVSALPEGLPLSRRAS
jgi:hypothetical protein